ncbi:MAG: hypothetical protein QQW96_17465 [Tychonema bourrellyi B0820]|nr:hypothetical protein [Tychonema bourrellyi B0820]
MRQPCTGEWPFAPTIHGKRLVGANGHSPLRTLQYHFKCVTAYQFRLHRNDRGDGNAHWCQLKKLGMRSHEQFCGDRLIRQLTCAAGTQAG